MMKKLITIIMLVLALAFVAGASEINFTYYIDNESGKACVSGILGDELPETVIIPSKIDGINVGRIENAVSVNEYGDVRYDTFDLKGAKHLVISEGIEKICNFTGMQNLETVRLPKSLKVLPSFAFAGASSLKSINLEFVESISSMAFEGCISLYEANLISAKNVGINAFNLIDGLRIYGLENSDAERYAKDTGSEFLKQPESEKTAIKLCSLGLMRGIGYTDGGILLFDLNRTPSRAEAITMLVRLLGKEKDALNTGKTHPFSDVPEWADGYVSYAYENGLTNGISDTLFGSEQLCTVEMYATFILRTLDYLEIGENKKFPDDNLWQIAETVGISSEKYNSGEFWRGELAEMSFDALQANINGTEDKLYEKLILENVFTEQDWEYTSVQFS